MPKSKKKRVRIKKIVCNAPAHTYQDERIKDLLANIESQGSYINVLQQKNTDLKNALGRANILCEVQARQYKIINEVLEMFRPPSDADLKKFLGEDTGDGRPVNACTPKRF